MPNYPLIPETSLQGTDIQYEGMAGCGKGQGQTPGPSLPFLSCCCRVHLLIYLTTY